MGGVDSRLKWASSCFLGTKNKAKAPDGPLQSLLHTVHSNVLVLFSCLLLLIYSGFLCAESMIPSRTVHSFLHSAHSNGMVILCYLLCGYTGLRKQCTFTPITKTCLYNFDPLKPQFYIVKLGFTGVYIIFLFLLKNIDCGYSLEPPRRGGSYG